MTRTTTLLTTVAQSFSSRDLHYHYLPLFFLSERSSATVRDTLWSKEATFMF
jgi:hypothetical protein